MIGTENDFFTTTHPTEGQRDLVSELTDRHEPPPWAHRAHSMTYTSICDRIYIDHMLFAGEWILGTDLIWRPMAMTGEAQPLPMELSHVEVAKRLKAGWTAIVHKIGSRCQAQMTQRQFDMLTIAMRVADSDGPGMRLTIKHLADADYSRALDSMITSVRYAMLDHPRAGYMISDLARYWHPYPSPTQAVGITDAH